MKKFLFGTTALAAVGLVLAGVSSASAQTAAPAPGFKSNSGFTVGISGYARQYVGYSSTKNAGSTVRNDGVDQQSDWRPIFSFAMPLSNGMTAGAVLQLNPLNNTSTGTAVTRRNWSYLSGGFGQVQIGAFDSVGAQMHTGSNEMFTGGTVKNDGKIYAFTTNPTANVTGTLHSTNADQLEARANKIAYFTPRFEGFQLGVNYTPEASIERNGGLPTSNTQYLNGWAVAANYINTFGGLGVRGYGSYTHQGKPSGVGLTEAQRAYHKDATHLGFGAGLSHSGFDIGGSYAKISDGRFNTVGATTLAAALGTVTVDGRAWEFGVNYTLGAFGVGINYFDGRNEAGTSDATGGVTKQVNGDDKRTGISLSGRYVMAPGVNIEGIVFNAKTTTGAAASTGLTTTDRSMTSNGALTALILAF